MTHVHFTGTHYRASGYHFTQPGDYEVTDEKAAQLLADFPHLFSVVESKTGPDKPQAAKQESPAEEVKLSKANRAQLEAAAFEVRLKVTPEMDTNARLRQAIERKRAEKIG